MFCRYSELTIFINNLLSYCGLVDAKIRASDKDLPVVFGKKRDNLILFLGSFYRYGSYKSYNINISQNTISSNSKNGPNNM